MSHGAAAPVADDLAARLAAIDECLRAVAYAPIYMRKIVEYGDVPDDAARAALAVADRAVGVVKDAAREAVMHVRRRTAAGALGEAKA